jgi:hypothetical protein
MRLARDERGQQVQASRKEDEVATPGIGSVAPAREPVRVLVFSASLRTGSLNTRLAELAARTIERRGGDVDVASMREFDAPSYDQDAQDGEGFPAGA